MTSKLNKKVRLVHKRKKPRQEIPHPNQTSQSIYPARGTYLALDSIKIKHDPIS